MNNFSKDSIQKKKIAFILPQMNQGGPARDFLNICDIIDHNKYEITLILFKPGGNFFSEISSKVKIRLAQPREVFETEININWFTKIKWKIIKLTIRVFSKFLKLFLDKSENTNWAITEIFINKLKGKYDLSMSLSEGISNYFLVNFIDAKIKVGRIPTDYLVAKLDRKFDIKYFQKLDLIATNSKLNLDILCNIFPEINKKFLHVETIVNPIILNKLAIKGKGFNDNFDGIRLVTLSRLDDTKGIDIAIKACKILVNKGNKKIKWYVFGDGSDLIKNKYSQMINDYNLNSHFYLMDPVNNPYPFVKQSNIYIQPSRYEGNSNAVIEAKALFRPVVLTNFNTSKEHLTNMFDGVISKDISEKGLANSIQLLISDSKLVSKIKNNLKNSIKGNQNELNKILNLI
tara:strand:- start:5554 stop:6762 length:1209 start_codon:yes stop_codon:yes gene_type:complete